jgi:PAS domain S-box-containing protein
METEIKILMLEDNESDFDLIKYELKKLKTAYTLKWVKNKAEFVSALNLELPDILLSDYNLPDINGQESLAYLREKDNEVPFILISSTIGEEKAVNLMRNGANDFIMKDKLKKLVPTIERELKEYENRKQAKIEHEQLVQSERDLAESEKKFRSLAENSGDRIERYDSECRHIYINPVSLKMTGQKFEEVIGKTHQELGYNENDYKFSDSLIKDVFKTGKPNGCVLDMRFGNTTKYYDWRLYPEFDEKGNVATVLSVSRDVTEIKKAQQELQKLTTAVEQSPSIILLTDTAGIVEYVNPRFTLITGYTLEEIQKKNPRILKSGEMSDEVYADMWKTIKSGKVWKGEFRNRKKNGELYWEGASVGPVFDSNGNIINFMKLSQDITDKKQLEKELYQERESLISSNKELEQFAYIASHDLQEPLRIVSSFAQLLQLKHSQRLNDEAKGYIEFVVTGSKRMQNLIKGLLEYSRITSSTKQKTIVNLSIPLKDALYNLNLSILEAHAEIKTEELPDVVVEPDQIAHVFQNLIGNALKFRKEGEHCLIEISSSKDSEKGELVISIKDNGAGINPKDFDKLFVIFKRLAHTSKKSGDGIGLALCRRIIERQGGRIWAESEGLGKGATFKFSLPMTIKDGLK